MRAEGEVTLRGGVLRKRNEGRRRAARHRDSLPVVSAAPIIAPTGVRMTFEEAAKLDPDTWRGDIVDGVWVAVPKSTWRHGAILANMVFLLKLHARTHPGLSVAVADPGVKLSRDPDVLRGPDVAVVRAERVPTGKGVAGWLDGAPDLAVEVVGDGQTVTGMLKKAAEYLRAGAKAVWVVDPDPAQVAVITADGLTVLGSDDTIEGGDALPSFACTVSEFFA